MIYWAFVGVIHLLILTYQDLKHKRLVDDRHNWFMMGATLSLLSLYKNKFLYILALCVITAILLSFIKKKGILGSADNKTILWSFIGFGIISYWILAYYAAIFIVIMILYQILAKIIAKVLKKEYKVLPGYPVFLVTFIVTIFIYK